MPTTAAPRGDVIDIARPIVERIIWCTVTTVAPTGSPRSRLMHPVWFWEDSTPFALVTARPTPIKVRHLAANPTVACFYWDPAHDTVAIDAIAAWLAPDERFEAWKRIAEVPAPVGFDPAIIWPQGPDAEDCGILRFDAHRIVATPAGRPGTRWNATPIEPHRPSADLPSAR